MDIFLSLLLLTLLEIVLGIDNLIFIALVVQSLPKKLQERARLIGLSLALAIRVIMLMGVAWVMSLTYPLFTVNTFEVSFKDILMLAGGLFLIAKSTIEIHENINMVEHKKKKLSARDTFTSVVAQIVIIDIVFSFDSVITAVGMTQNIPVIVIAMVISMIVMVAASGHIASVLEKHPTFKVLALSFILLIGTLLIAEGMHFHVPRGYVYFAFAFSIFVESMNTIARSRSK